MQKDMAHDQHLNIWGKNKMEREARKLLEKLRKGKKDKGGGALERMTPQEQIICAIVQRDGAKGA